jgi:hypothetical protein
VVVISPDEDMTRETDHVPPSWQRALQSSGAAR